jgi:rhodanese-related sulfurtransferase
VVLRVAHTPGHRPESISLLITNTARSPEPSMVLSGDTLFVGDVGRPDFGGPQGGVEQYESVEKLLALPDYVEVYPAHFEGSCGQGMCGRPNPVLQLDRERFVALTAEVPARPLNMTAIIAANRGAAGYPYPPAPLDADVTEVSIDDAPGWLDQHPGAVVLDVREPEEWAAGHLPGARLLPQADLATRLDEVPRDTDVLVVCAGGVRSRRAAGFLEALGYTRVATLSEGTDAWRAAGKPIEIPAPVPS